ncbi:hypothetical protein [Acinetobacter sp. GN11]
MVKKLPFSFLTGYRIKADQNLPRGREDKWFLISLKIEGVVKRKIILSILCILISEGDDPIADFLIF